MQMVARLQFRRDLDQPVAHRRDQQCVAGIQPDRRWKRREAADHDGAERDAGDEQEIEKPPFDVFAADIVSARPDLDVRQPAQSKHAETQDIGQHFRPQIEQAPQKRVAVGRVEVVGQADIQDQQRHGDGENAVAERIEPCF